MTEPTVKKFPSIKRSLAPKPRLEPQPDSPENETIAAGAEPRPLAAVPSPQPTETKRKKPSHSTRQSTRSQQGSKTLSFLIPDDLRAAYKARATRDQQSLPNVLLDAIEATHHDLDGELQAEAPARQPTGMFARPQHREAAGNQSTMVIPYRSKQQRLSTNSGRTPTPTTAANTFAPRYENISWFRPCELKNPEYRNSRPAVVRKVAQQAVAQSM